jgi:very-short-patch-repair endonuclease
VAYVVELDDWSHDTAKRRSRDMGVEEMLKSAGIKLVRFRDVANMSDEDIINVFKSTQGVKDEMTAL